MSCSHHLHCAVPRRRNADVGSSRFHLCGPPLAPLRLIPPIRARRPQPPSPAAGKVRWRRQGRRWRAGGGRPVPCRWSVAVGFCCVARRAAGRRGGRCRGRRFRRWPPRPRCARGLVAFPVLVPLLRVREWVGSAATETGGAVVWPCPCSRRPSRLVSSCSHCAPSATRVQASQPGWLGCCCSCLAPPAF
jgi:hypothetical protein